MKNILAIIIASSCLITAAQAQSAIPSKEELELASFDKIPISASYGSWKQMVISKETGIEISGTATAKGGAIVDTSADLSSFHGLSITLKVLPSNQAIGLNVILQGPDDRASGYRFELGAASEKATTMKVALEKPFFKPLSAINGHVDLMDIQKIQIQGDYKDDAPIAIELIKLEAYPAPSFK